MDTRLNNTALLVLTGFATSGVVLSTLREAADKDFQLTVLSDACVDGKAALPHFASVGTFGSGRTASSDSKLRTFAAQKIVGTADRR